LGVSQVTVHLDLKNEQNFSLPGNKVNEYQDLENVNEQNFSLPSSITRTGSEVVKLAIELLWLPHTHRSGLASLNSSGSSLNPQTL